MRLLCPLAAGWLVLIASSVKAQHSGLEDLARLIPRDAFAVAVLPSLESTQQSLDHVLAAIDEELVPQGNVARILATAVKDVSLVDRTAPLAIALVLAADPLEDPTPALVLPVKDIEAFRASQGAGTFPARGRHVLCVIGPDLVVEDEVSALARDLPEADLLVRLDLERLAKAFRPFLEDLLTPEAFAQGDPELTSVIEPFLGFAREFLESAERLELVLQLDGTRVDAEFRFLAREGSPLARSSGAEPQLDRLARLLPSGYPLSCLVSYDLHAMMRWLEPMVVSFAEAMPDGTREAYVAKFRESLSTYRHLGEDALICAGFGARGFEMVGLSTAKDPVAYLEESLRDADSMRAFGVEMERLPGRRASEVEIGRARLRMDYRTYLGEAAEEIPEEFLETMWSKMFGPGGWVMEFAAVDDLVVYSMGARGAVLDHVLETARSEGRGVVPTNIAELLQRSGGRPSFLLNLEFRAFLSGLMELVAEITGQPLGDLSRGEPVNLSVFTVREGREHRLGLLFDLGSLMRFLRELQDL